MWKVDTAEEEDKEKTTYHFTGPGSNNDPTSCPYACNAGYNVDSSMFVACPTGKYKYALICKKNAKNMPMLFKVPKQSAAWHYNSTIKEKDIKFLPVSEGYI
jgi:hypothetical protein